MFGRKKETPKERRPRTNRNLEQLGIFEVPANLADMGGQIQHDDTDDEDLEAELAALTTNDKPKRSARPKPVPKPAVDLDKMISESMKDFNSDEELSGDENDSDLLDELKFITGDKTEELKADTTDHTNDTENDTTKLLEERLAMYKIAEEKAKSENETSKARRFNRGIKTLEQLLSSSRSGNEIDPSEIPPILSASAIGKSVPKPNDQPNEDMPPLTSLPSETPSAVGPPEEDTGDKEIENQNAPADEPNLIDMSSLPSLPTQTSIVVNPPEEPKEESENQMAAEPNLTVPGPEEAGSTGSLESALKERLEIYRRSKTVAETEGNSSKVRRYGRICKQFEDALKLHAKGKPVPISELPTPPGLPPLSNTGASHEIPSKPVPKPVPHEAKISEPVPKEPAEPIPSTSKASTPVAPPRTNSDKKKKLTSRVDKQMEMLEQRKLELKMAALKAKKEGDLDLARNYLRQAKGIDPLLAASLAGLPVDMNSIPLSPEAKLQLKEQDPIPASVSDDGFTVISTMDCPEEATGTDQEIYENLEQQLKKQIKWCLTTRDYCKALGDVANYNKWERLALDYKKDLDMLRVNKRNELPPPKHHYELKTYSIVQSCTDLADGDIEISIIRGINYSKEVDSYIIFEFPWPSDSPTSDRTSTVRGTNNPEYNATFPYTGILDRKSRQCLRLFKRHSLKCQIWSKGGFLRADSLLGTVNVKLQPLETKCVLHDSFPLMDGRKAVGGKLEVKIRLRNPITTKQIEQNKDKWLAIDH